MALMREANACALAKDFVCVKRSNKARVCKACEKFELCTPSAKRAYENAVKPGLIKEKPSRDKPGGGVCLARGAPRAF